MLDREVHSGGEVAVALGDQRPYVLPAAAQGGTTAVEFLSAPGDAARVPPPPPADVLVASAERTIDAALIDLDFPGPIERRVELGSPVAILVEESSRSDLLACGSRVYGLVR